MAQRVQGFHAREQLRGYVEAAEDLRKKAEKNFLEMDFENADRRQEAEEIVGDMMRVCDNAVAAMEGITFE